MDELDIYDAFPVSENPLLESVEVVVCFIDIRGFTTFVSNAAANDQRYVDLLLEGFFDSLDKALKDVNLVFNETPFGEAIRKCARPTMTKTLGDGAMIVWQTPVTRDDHVKDGFRLYILDVLQNLQTEFYNFKEKFLHKYININHLITPLELGIGLNCGLAWKLTGLGSNGVDYTSTTINIAARLQDQARPRGIVAQFGFAPNHFLERKYTHQEGEITYLKLKGINEPVDVWKCTSKQVIYRRHPRKVGSFMEAQTSIPINDKLHNWVKSPLTKDDTYTIFDVRTKFEVQFAIDLTNRLKASSDLISVFEKIDPLVFKGKFHEAVARLSATDIAEGENRAAFIVWAYEQTKEVHDFARVADELVKQQHRSIFDAIKLGQEENVRKSMTNHLRENCNDGRSKLLIEQRIKYEKEKQLKEKLLKVYEKNLKELYYQPTSTVTKKHKHKARLVANKTRNLIEIATAGIQHIEDLNLRKALMEVYERQSIKQASLTAQGVFDRLVTSNWPEETLQRFISGWRATHGTALFVSGLIIRILREAYGLTGGQSLLAYKAAKEIGEIICEDTGVDDIPHSELFTTFANALCDNDNWKLLEAAVPQCENFRSFVKRKRLEAPVEEAILITAASENWNTGEYTYFSQFVQIWLTETIGLSEQQMVQASTYVNGHAGDTELKHFLHAIKSWQLFCQATGKKADPAFAARVFESYIMEIRPAYEALQSILS